MILPIDAVISDIQRVLAQRHELVLEAPPGAGKTTVVPLKLLDAPWRHGKILLLEPRRMAARAVAQRMAELLNETIGGRVGYRIRQDTQVSAQTLIEVVTSGVLLRILQQDPALTDYSLVIFDEFHERNLDSDFALSLCLNSRQLFREAHSPLKLLVMSATLDSAATAEFVDRAPVIRSEGKAFPVEVFYQGECARLNIVAKVYETVLLAHRQHQGNILVFLPGQKEILSCQQMLRSTLDPGTEILPLYGALPLQQQMQAIGTVTGCDFAKRKIVLATDIAETSLTIEGISVVVDSCYQRSPAFDRKTGLTRLTTKRISRASAKQRCGRAGRLSAGYCYRLLAVSTTLQDFSGAEIQQADLTALVLQMWQYGVNSPDDLNWLTPPPSNAYQSAVALLQQLGAFTTNKGLVQLSEHGQAMSVFSAHPRLSHMILRGAELNLATEACFLAACLSEPGRPAHMGNNIEDWLETGLRQHRENPWLQRVQRQSKEFARQLQALQPPQVTGSVVLQAPVGLLLALAYPDRIARQRDGDLNLYVLSSGRAARLENHHPLSKCTWLSVAETGSVDGAKEERIFTAARLDEQDLRTHLQEQIQVQEIVQWDSTLGRFIAEKQLKVGALILAKSRVENVAPERQQQAIAEFIRNSDLTALNWTSACEQLCQRVTLLRKLQLPTPETFPDCSSSALKNTLDLWLTPYLNALRTAQEIKKLDIENLLKNYIGWSNLATLDRLAPTHIQVPSGFSVAIDYAHSPPILEVKLQEMFGCAETPSVGDGKIRLLLHLLSPARRPLQVTQDLAGFWRGSYKDVQKEMKGRYPKHPWPDDPQSAQATRYTKKRTQESQG